MAAGEYAGYLVVAAFAAAVVGTDVTEYAQEGQVCIPGFCQEESDFVMRKPVDAGIGALEALVVAAGALVLRRRDRQPG